MALYLIHADGHALLASDQPFIKASEHGIVQEAAAMLATIRQLHAGQAQALVAAQAEAAARGREAGEQAGQIAFATAIVELVRQAEADRDRREEEIARLALAALRQMVGALATGDLMAGIARRAAESVGSKGPLVVEVAPSVAIDVERALETLPFRVDVTVRGDAALRQEQCRVTAPDSRIIADLDVQLAAFERRWEADHAG